MTRASDPPPISGMALVALLAAAAAAIGGVLLFYWKHDVFAPREATPASQTAATPGTFAQLPNRGDKDIQFLLLLADQGLAATGTADAAIKDAHAVCSRVARGESEQQIVADIVAGSPAMSMTTAATFADIAIGAYCPQGY